MDSMGTNNLNNTDNKENLNNNVNVGADKLLVESEYPNNCKAAVDDIGDSVGNIESSIDNNESLNGSNSISCDEISSDSEGFTGGNELSVNTSTGYEEPLKSASYYSESYKKTSGRKNNSLLQLIIVALVSSILGGSVVAGLYAFVVPGIQSSANSYFSKFLPQKSTLNNSSQNAVEGLYKKVEIEKSDSPVTAIAEKVSPSIVGVKLTVSVKDFFLGEQQVTPEGSGIIIKSDGYIITNNHVIADAYSSRTGELISGAKIEVFLPSEKDKPYVATVIGRDEKTDLAVLKINATNLPAAELGNSDEIKPGELAVAIGNPGGMEYMGSVTVGVISGLNRTIPIEDNKELKLVQTDAAINPGNSGGALANSRGQVIGVNTAKIGGDGYEGLGFAIPINKVKEITDSLMEFKYVKGRPFLGVTIDQRFNEQIAKQYNVPKGLLVSDVSPLSGAYKGGIKIGDIITKFDGKAVKAFSELEEQKNKHKPGDVVKVEIYRDGENKTLQVTLSENTGNQ